MKNFISIKNLNKIYKNNFVALNNLNLNIEKGEIFALLGPNGAGKSTLINVICGIISFNSGSVLVNNLDIVKDYRRTRSLIGIVPQELQLEAFETVWNNICYTRGLYGKSKNLNYLEKLIKDLSLWDKKKNHLRELSGGMKRRVLIAKALSHEPKILFLDEPTASVDVELRKDMWKIIKELKQKGVTIILTTHYIEEAEEIADRVGIINNGKIIVVDKKENLIEKLGEKKIIINLEKSLNLVPKPLQDLNLEFNEDKNKIIFKYNIKTNEKSITTLLDILRKNGLIIKDIDTEKSSLESIFINLVKGKSDEFLRS